MRYTRFRVQPFNLPFPIYSVNLQHLSQAEYTYEHSDARVNLYPDRFFYKKFAESYNAYNKVPRAQKSSRNFRLLSLLPTSKRPFTCKVLVRSFTILPGVIVWARKINSQTYITSTRYKPLSRRASKRKSFADRQIRYPGRVKGKFKD